MTSEKVEKVAEIEDFVLGVSPANVQMSAVRLLVSAGDDQNLIRNLIPYFFINSVRMRPGKIEVLADLLTRVWQEQFSNLPGDVLDKIFEFAPGETDQFQTEYGTKLPCDMLFVHHLIKYGAVEQEDVVKRVEEFHRAHPNHDFDCLIMFAWFAPEIEAINTDLYESLVKSLAQTRSKLWKAPCFEPFFHGFEKLRGNAWEELKTLRQIGSDLSNAILCDDCDKLQRLIGESGDANKRVFPSIYERFGHMSQLAVPVLDLCSLFGSVKCFRFLMINNAAIVVENQQTSRSSAFSRFYTKDAVNPLDFLIYGGCREIIRIYEQRGCKFEGTLEAAVRSHQNDVFFWILEKEGVSISESLVPLAIQSDNGDILPYLITSLGSDVPVCSPKAPPFARMVLQ